VVSDVDHVAIGCPDEESTVTPWLCRDRANDLVAEPLGLVISTADVVGEDGDDCVFGSGLVVGDE